MTVDIKTLKSEITCLQAEVSFIQDDHSLNTKDGQRFNNVTKMCAMELAGELEVSSSHVPKIIQCVSKWLFCKQVQLSDLPSASTVVNMVDRAHVLSKLQVTENLLQPQRWDLHTDGTSWDHKKVISKQITLDTGATLSTGFAPIAVEDSATLLDNVVAMIN